MDRVYKRKYVLAISCHFFIQLVHGHGCTVAGLQFLHVFRSSATKIRFTRINSDVKVSNRKLIQNIACFSSWQLMNIQICVHILDMLIYFSRDIPGVPKKNFTCLISCNLKTIKVVELK